MKICVFMSDNRKLSTDRETADYNSLSAVINYEYCKKHNYDFIYYRPYLYNENEITLNNCIDPNTKLFRHPSWSKILSTKLAFKLTASFNKLSSLIDSNTIYPCWVKKIVVQSYTLPGRHSLLMDFQNIV